VLGIIVTTGNELLPKDLVESFHLPLFEEVFGWKLTAEMIKEPTESSNDIVVA
jgi:hypothetical protein